LAAQERDQLAQRLRQATTQLEEITVTRKYFRELQAWCAFSIERHPLSISPAAFPIV
jgi:hypothetical protein